MSYEINIIVINQSTPVHLKHSTRVLLHNEVEDSEFNRYAEIWPFFSSNKGILYTIVEEINDGFYNASKLCDSDFEGAVPENLFPVWISTKIKENLTPLLIRDGLHGEFINIIQYLLNCAPQKRILFQTRYQGGDEEVVLGVIKISKFKEMLIKKQILFNVCYILESD